MRVLAATIGALLISVSHTALAQDHQDGQQEMPAQAERHTPGPAVLPQVMMPVDEDEPGQREEEQPEAQSPETPHDQSEAQPAARPEDLLAQLPERQPPSEIRKPTMRAEDLLAQLPERQPAQLSGMPQPMMRAEDLLAQLPERQPAQSSAMRQPTMHAEGLLAQLPERRPEQPSAVRQPTMRAEDLLAQLPERQPAQPPAMRQTVRRAADLLAQLPERPLPQTAASAEEPEYPSLPEALKARMHDDRPGRMELPHDPRWSFLKERSVGVTLDLPHALFSVADGGIRNGSGLLYRTPDGRARVAVWTQHDNRQDTPAGYLRRTFSIPRATVDYERATPEFAVVSGIHGSRIYYIRCNLDRRSRTFYCFDLAYPAWEKAAWDGIVTRMSRSLRPLGH